MMNTETSPAGTNDAKGDTYYIGITLGPVVETLMNAHSPASLWASSFLFSMISYELCRIIKDCLGLTLISPHFEKDPSRANSKGNTKTDEMTDEIYDYLPDGVGIFPERIILKATENDEQKAKDAMQRIMYKKVEIIEKIAERFCDGQSTVAPKALPDYPKGYEPITPETLTNYLVEKYVQMHAVVFCATEKDFITKSASLLDVIELGRSFPTSEADNPLLELLEYHFGRNKEKKEHRNLRIKRSPFVERFGDEWPLLDKEKKSKEGKRTIRDLEDIACDGQYGGPFMKKKSYYAVLNFDGDGMGSLFQEEGVDTKKLSKELWNYSRDVAKAIKDFHGVPLYVGGDDILALAPLENNEGKNILELAIEIQGLFSSHFSDSSNTDKKATVSAGISLNYYKFPLYEALEKAYELLRQAKDKGCAKDGNDKKKKNTLAIHLRKHSGRQIGLYFRNWGTPDDKQGIHDHCLKNAEGKCLEASHHRCLQDTPNQCLKETASWIASLTEMASLTRSPSNPSGKAAESFNASISKLGLLNEVFATALHKDKGTSGNPTFRRAIDNLLKEDSGRDENKEHRQKIVTLTGLIDDSSCVTDTAILNPAKKSSPEKEKLETLDSLLRFIKFFVETGKEEEDGKQTGKNSI